MLSIVTADSERPRNRDRELLSGDVRVCLTGMEVDTTLVLIERDPALLVSSSPELSRKNVRPEIAQSIHVVLCLQFLANFSNFVKSNASARSPSGSEHEAVRITVSPQKFEVLLHYAQAGWCFFHGLLLLGLAPFLIYRSRLAIINQDQQHNGPPRG